MKIPMAAILAAALSLLPGCGNQNASQQQAEEPPATVSVPEAGIHTIIVTGDLDGLRQHIQAGSDLEEMEPSRASTPLITAAFAGNADAARLLIEAGADINYQNDDGSTALHTAAVFGKTDVAKLLIDAGAKLDVPNKEGATALHTAAFFGRTEIVKALLDKGADKTIKNGVGKTALETVQAPFEEVKPLYDAVGAGLAPMGLQLDYERIAAARPQIAELLK
ncbi:MAG: ankyrin repeat domain-containing protein [Phaeodactylibacter sp.]|nr:ankyrin repeat domain-containing protein [Phaeodactylibacter sp.]